MPEPYEATLKSIEFDDDEKPSYVTVRLPVKIAIYLGMLTGKQNSLTAEEIAPGLGSSANNHAYSLFAGGVANRFWDGGLPEAHRDLRDE